VTIAPSAKQSSDINLCDENLLYDLLNKYNFLIFVHSASFFKIVHLNPRILNNSRVPNVRKLRNFIYLVERITHFLYKSKYQKFCLPR